MCKLRISLHTKKMGMTMKDITVGMNIGVPCEVQEGPFDDEKMVQFDTVDGPVSGFAQSENIRESEGQYFIKGEVIELGHDTMTVLIEGSFFSTNGLANFAKTQEFMPIAA